MISSKLIAYLSSIPSRLQGIPIEMHNILIFLRLYGLFPRRFKKSRDTGQLSVGRLYMPYLLYSVAILIIRFTLMITQIDLLLFFNQEAEFAQFLSLMLWGLAWLLSEFVSSITLILKHNKLCHILQELGKFQPFIERTTLSRNQKVVITLRILGILVSFFVQMSYYGINSTNWIAYLHQEMSFLFCLLFQICIFIIINELGGIVRAVVQADGITLYEKINNESLSKGFRHRTNKTILREKGRGISALESCQQENIISAYKITKLIEEKTSTVSDIFGFAILLELLYCLVGVTFTIFNLILSATRKSFPLVVDYFSFIFQFTASAWGLAGLLKGMIEEVSNFFIFMSWSMVETFKNGVSFRKSQKRLNEIILMLVHTKINFGKLV